MKRLCHLISILFAAMITLCFTITAFADEKKYDIDFTREEAYAAVMNTTPTQAKNLYGGDVSYYEALTDEDKEQLFDAMWNLTESGLLYEGTSTVHLSGFADEYFSAVIDGFRETESTEEGLNNLHDLIEDIHSYCDDSASPEDKADIVEKEEPEETTKRIQQEITTAANAPETTAQVTTIPVTEQKESNHTGLIVFLCIVAVGAAAGISYYVIQKKHQK